MATRKIEAAKRADKDMTLLATSLQHNTQGHPETHLGGEPALIGDRGATIATKLQLVSNQKSEAEIQHHFGQSTTTLTA
jgi:hypothetical protein